MKRIVTIVATLGLTVAACGSGDSESASTTAPAVEADEPTADEPTADDSADESAEQSEPEEATDDAVVDEPTADESDNDANSATDNRKVISSLDDIPDRCRDLMEDFLREIEPIVSPIDWQTASLNDFEAIGAEFESMSDSLEARGESAGCNDLDFAGDSEFDLMIQVADDIAPGTIGFLEFIASFEPGASGNDSTTSADIETCEDGVAFMQDLIDNYDTITDVPATELVKFQQLSVVFMTCTPDQLAFLDSPEVGSFLGE